ncbi:MAG: MlaD family protein [Gemmatimonadota bacterium]|nr:MlaD family protein [Gemmatimonadota bacterium]
MDIRRPDSWRDVLPGIGVMVALILLGLAVFWLDTMRRAFLDGPTVVLLAEQIRGVAPGASVWVAGKPAGRVQSIEFVGSGTSEPVLVALRVVLSHEVAPSVRADATARIGSSSLLAPPVIKLRPGSPTAPPYDFRDTLTVTRGPDMETFLAFADSGRAALAELSEQRARLSAALATGSGTLPRLGRDPVSLDGLAETGRQTRVLRGLWTEWNRPGRTDDSSLRAHLTRLAESMATISERADARSSAIDPVAKTMERLGNRMERMDEHLRAARGTTGRLLHDGELQSQAERTRAQLDSLQTELAAHPFRWLRFRLF